MEIQELESLLSDLESDRIERKASASDKKKIQQAICAFANDLPNQRKPGVIFVGVHDNGRCAHLPVTDQLLLTLSQMREQTLPFPSMRVQKQVLRGCEMAVVIVEPSDAPPVRYDGRVWVRVGPRRAIATPEEERRLNEKRRAKDLPFDLQPIPSATLSHLDIDIFRRRYLPKILPEDMREENGRLVEHQLTSTRFATLGDPPTPTTLGLLAIGKDPRRFLPGAYIQFLRVDGREITDAIKDSKEVHGHVRAMLRCLDAVFQNNISTMSDVATGAEEIRQSDYPVAALRQLAYNAVLHRAYESTNAPVRITWFDDRIEIFSPGGPFGQVHKQNFGQPGITDYRNAHLAEVMKNMGYVQRFGLGIPLAQQALRKNGNPPAEFVVEDAHILATIRRRP